MQGWWTYEYCHNQLARQIHYNQDGVSEQVIDLGRFNPESQPKQLPSQAALLPDGSLLGYYRILLTEGDWCDLDNEARSCHFIPQINLLQSCCYQCILIRQDLRAIWSVLILRNSSASQGHSQLRA